MTTVQRFFLSIWYHQNPLALALALWPFSVVFGWLVQFRRRRYQLDKAQVYRPPVPIVVVGNINVGGTGKTPLTIWLVEQLRELGYQPGVVSRGYGGQAPNYPHRVNESDSASMVGDEPLMIFLRSRVPLMVDPDRSRAVKALLEQTDVDVIISDDGLQHYGLARTVELVVVDGERGFGNSHIMPMGPLREPVKRLQEVDAVIITGEGTHPSIRADLPLWDGVRRFRMRIEPGKLVALNSASEASLLVGRLGVVESVAGIGNPQRFFDTLDDLGVIHSPHVFSDHHDYTEMDLETIQDKFILTTEKDAVKLRKFSQMRGAYLPVSARLPDGLIDVILSRLQAFQRQKQHRY